MSISNSPIAKRMLGSTGLSVSEIGFGSSPFSGRTYGRIDREQASNALRTYLHRGGNFIDTARSYNDAELIIGEVIKETGNRDKLVLASKTARIAESDIRRHLEESLQALGTDYLDVLYLHWPPEDDAEKRDVLRIFSKLKNEKLVKAIGVSIPGPDVTSDSVCMAKWFLETGQVDVLQLIFSVLRQKFRNVIADAHARGMGVVCRTVLESGFLNGKYRPGARFDDKRKRWNPSMLRNIYDSVARLEEFALPEYESLGKFATRFVLDEPDVSSAIIGAKSEDQLLSNLSAASMPPLDREIRSRLLAVYANETEKYNAGKRPLPSRIIRKIRRTLHV